MKASYPRFFVPLMTCGVTLMSTATATRAQYQTGFENPPYVAGMDLVGQDNFYNPVPASSVSAVVHTYAGNPAGLPQNPTGGDQFALAIGPGPIGSPPVQTFSRSQRDMVYGDGTGVWSTCYDLAVKFTGTLPAAQNAGSFSTQTFAAPNPSDQTFIALATWTDPTTAANWNANYVWFDTAGAQLQEAVPNAQTLLTNHWYRWCTEFNLDTNAITQVSITDLTTNVTVSHTPVNRFMFGGAAGTVNPPPDGFRLFAGSTTAGNTIGWDNVSITPEPGAILLLAFGALVLRRRA